MLRKILVVEDNEINRKILCGILQTEYEVLEAENGEEALAVLHKKHRIISAVLLDLMMPVMDGFDVLKKMRANAVLAQIPVIVATGAAQEEMEVRALSLGANDFVTKPYNPVLILHCLRNTINLRETASIMNAIQRDKLTGLYNREAFFEKAAVLLKEHEPGYYVMACFDIDHFKVINDQYGAAEGDRILRHIGKVALECFHAVDGISSRISADNFAALYPAGARENEYVTGQRERMLCPPDTHANITCSVGRYIVTDLTLSASAVYDRAYLAKQSVKGRYDQHTAYFSESMREKLIRDQEIISDMDTALAHQEFEVWFQPQFNHTTGALIGAEALVRWRHARKGLIPPDKFIPVFEQNGFIYEMDKYVWDQVCALLRKWIDGGRAPLPVSVNISRYDVYRADFFEYITGLTEKYRLPPDLLRLEVTESAFAVSAEQIIAMVKRLMAYGFTVEIDDFGSGYSSLNTLKDVPATVLKLDMKFFEATGDSKRGGNIVESVVRMAKWLGMSVVAEGVETKAQADYLRSIGCNYIQGYLYAKPMPTKDYETLLESAAKEERLLALETVENLDNNAFWDPQSMDTLIFNSYVGGACIFEYHGNTIELLRANEKYAQVIGSIGMTVEDALRLNWTDYLDAKNLAALQKALGLSIQTGDSVTGEFMFLRLPGCPEETYLRSTMRVIARSGDHYLVYCTNENTTPQRQAEKKELQTAEHLRAIMSNINGGVTAAVMWEGKPQILFANEQYYRQLGYTKAQYEKEVSNPHDLIHPEDRPAVIAQTLEASENRAPFTAVYRVIRRDQSVIWLQNNISITAFADVQEPVQLAVANDITKMRGAEERARRASEQLKAVMEDVGSGITASILTDGDVRFLLTNDRYYAILGFTRAQYEAEVKNIFDLIHPEDRARIAKIARDAYQTESSARAEYRVIRRDGALRWVRAVLSSTSFSGVDKPVQLCDFLDITAEKDAAQSLLETDEQLRFLNEMAHDLLAQPDSEQGLREALQRLLNYFDGNRAYIFELDEEGQFARNTYEVCAPDVTSEIDNLQRVSYDTCGLWLRIFEKRHYVFIADVDALEESRAEERAALQAQGIRSLVAVPLRRDGKLIGFIGIDDPRSQRARIDRLAAIGDYLAVMLTRRDLEMKIHSDNQTLLSLMNDTPGGFVRMRVRADGTIVPVYFNEGFCKLVGMSQAALMRLYGENAMAGVHPDDLDVVRQAAAGMLEKGEGKSAKYRLLRGAGGYVWVMIFGRMTKNEAGERFLNIYYTDVTEQNRLDEIRAELLENLPCGAGIYEIVQGKPQATYWNKRFRAYLKREIGDLGVTTVFDWVHPEDRDKLRRTMERALKQRQEESCDIRIMDRDGNYLLFRLIGSAMERDQGENALYVTFTPITQDEIAYSKMLPVALSAVIGASPDSAFVKDWNHRYVCCSRAFAALAGLRDPAEIAGKTDEDLVDSKRAAQYRAGEETLLEKGEAHLDYEEVLPSRDDAVRYVNTSKYPLLDAAGNVVGIYGVIRDITRAKDKESQLQLLTESIPGGLATYECAPGHIKITYFNDGFCRLFGVTREEYQKESAINPTGRVFDEDLPELLRQLDRQLRENTPIECMYRVHVEGGGYKWLAHKGVVAARRQDTILANAVLLDVTERQEATERLRISEEEHRLALEHSGSIIGRYHIAEKRLTMSTDGAKMLGISRVVENVPEAPVRDGQISPDSVAAYTGFFAGILRGDQLGKVIFQQLTPKGWRWLEARFSNIFSDAGKPVSAVVSFSDVTERLEKENIYKKWQQSLQEKDPKSYTLFRCNLSKDASFDAMEGELLRVVFRPEDVSFNGRTMEYVEQFVYEGDRAQYIATLDSDTLLANYYRGKRAASLEYREKQPDGSLRWLRLSIELVEYPNSTEVEAYLMYENIDDSKRAALLTLERAETDPLTGTLNRLTFAARVDQILRASKPDTRHALLMMDIDGFKQVNDVFGHAAGDQALIDTAAAMRSALRRGDLLGRLGGDEFVVFLSDLPNDAVAENKARQLCGLIRKSFSLEVEITGSIGMVIAPRDGRDFKTLYQKADAALYFVKGSGKDHCAFYREDMRDQHLKPEEPAGASPAPAREKRRRMLIVDDSRIDCALLAHLFQEDFILESAKDGASALIRLRHYGSAISVVLLDLMMPGMDGFAVLEKMQSSAELQSIPVIVVSGDDQPETSLRAIRLGATDFVTKPVNPELLRLRVQSAISKAENERLRAQNSFLKLQSDEVAKYRTVLAHTGMALLEYDWINDTFDYDASMAAHLDGVWDQRALWKILLSDGVADAQTVQSMQAFVRRAAEDQAPWEAGMTASLRTPDKTLGVFCINVYKLAQEEQLPHRLVITFTPAHGLARTSANK